jgi:hypothetical protein
MYFIHWEPPGVSERMCSVNLDASISGEYYQTLGGHSCQLSEKLGALATSLGAQTTRPGIPRSAGDKSGNTSDRPESAGNKPGRASDKSASASDMSESTSNYSRAIWEIQHLWQCCRCDWK